jgi:REP element-mobilizing transposase RayT
MESGQTYHIFNHANGNENIFREEENYRFFLSKYSQYLGEVVDTHAFCLLPNHFHLLVTVKSESHLLETFPKFGTLEKLVSKQFSNFFSSYTQAFNKKYQRMGSLFMKNFKRKPILNLEQWQETFLYIHLNPVKHGFVKHPQDWKWSSWQVYENFSKPSRLEREYFKNFFDHWDQVKYLVDEKKELILAREFE